MWHHQQLSMRAPVSSHPCQHLVWSVFLILVILIGIYLIVVFSCISLMTSHFEYLFLCFFAIHISSLVVFTKIDLYPDLRAHTLGSAVWGWGSPGGGRRPCRGLSWATATGCYVHLSGVTRPERTLQRRAHRRAPETPARTLNVSLLFQGLGLHLANGTSQTSGARWACRAGPVGTKPPAAARGTNQLPGVTFGRFCSFLGRAAGLLGSKPHRRHPSNAGVPQQGLGPVSRGLASDVRKTRNDRNTSLAWFPHLPS